MREVSERMVHLLIDLARASVLEQFGVRLDTEVHLLDRQGYRPLHDDAAGGTS